MWRPSASIEAIKYRAKVNKYIRQFFEDRNVTEVETPILSRFATTDPAIESFFCTLNKDVQKPQAKRYLQTSPEFAMKRLLAAGSGSIFQLCKVFRQEELGRWHNPEFTMLEWYRPGMSYHKLMDEVADLIRSLFVQLRCSKDITELSLSDSDKSLDQNIVPISKISYADLFKKYLDIDPHVIHLKSLIPLLTDNCIELVDGTEGLDKNSCLQLLLTHVIEPEMPRHELMFVFDYPASQASLARLDTRIDHKVALRFECFFNGVELANGFQELTSAPEQLQRFEADIRQRVEKNLTLYPLDEFLIDAMQCTAEHSGLPECAGVAIGIDRVLASGLEMSACQAPNRHKNALSTVLAFNFERT